jgi:glycosyltransferase involved in cell wall biosynthesis
MLHIMHVADRLSIGGKERILVDLANQTVTDGHLVSVCLVCPGEELVASLRGEIGVWKLNCRAYDAGDEPAMSRFAGIVAGGNVSILHIHGRPALKFVSTVAGKYPLEPPMVFHDHFGGIETDFSVPDWFRFGASRLLSHYVGVCDKLASWAEGAGVPGHRITVLGNALDLNRFDVPGVNIRGQLGIPKSVSLGIFIAGLRPNKGLDVLLNVLPLVVGRTPVKLLVVGGIRNKEYAEICHQKVLRLGLEQQVQFLGERADAVNLLPGVDFAVHPARSESGPLVLVEYAARAVPFVASLVGDIAHRLRAFGLPEFVPPGDPKALAGALDRLLSLSPEDRSRRGRRGREIALKEFDVREKLHRWLDIYRSTVEGTGLETKLNP